MPLLNIMMLNIFSLKKCFTAYKVITYVSHLHIPLYALAIYYITVCNTHLPLVLHDPRLLSVEHMARYSLFYLTLVWHLQILGHVRFVPFP